jgi:YVTN family beta-propeller protein
MTMKKIQFLMVMLFLIAGQILFAQEKTVQYKVIKNIPVAGNGSWDCLTADYHTAMLYISHGDKVDVYNLKTDKVEGQILNVQGVHGIACVHEFNKGFITAGKSDSVIVFDMTTLGILKKIKAGQEPDGIAYDGLFKKIMVANAKSNTITIIDSKTDHVDGTIELPGKPTAILSDDRGIIYCSLLDKSSVLKIDLDSKKIMAEWPLKPGKEPTSLALSVRDSHLYAACGKSKQLIVLSSINGTISDTIPIGEGCEGVAFVPEDRTLVAANSDGTLTVIQQKDSGECKKIQTLKTKKGARTIAYARLNRKLYLPHADVIIENGKKKIVPGSFGVLVVGR